MPNADFQSTIDRYKQDLMKAYRRSGRSPRAVLAAAPVRPLNPTPSHVPLEQPSATGDTEPIPVTPTVPRTYEEFLQQNPKSGTLKIQAFLGDQSIPLSGVNILITKNIGGAPYTLYNVVTDESGIVDGILLPAPDKKLSESPIVGVEPFATYDIVATHPGYQRQIYLATAVFDGVKSIQPVRMIPDAIGG